LVSQTEADYDREEQPVKHATPNKSLDASGGSVFLN